MQYRKFEGIELKLASGRPVTEAYKHPLLFSPGDAWEYSGGVDWAGLMVERVNGNIPLEAYMEKYIWGPLCRKDFSCHVSKRPDIKAKMMEMSWREGGVESIFGVTTNPSGKVEYTADRVWDPTVEVECYGGAGGFGSPLEYHKLLQSLCSDDGKVLKPATVAEMFKPQLSDASKKSLMEKFSIKEVNDCFGGLPMGMKLDWGIGGIMNLEDLPGRRKKGSIAWVGLPNLSWFIDREDDMCGIYGGQLCPPGDPKTNGFAAMFEEEMYERAKDSKQKL
jgi:CubicO group peptidase (beta-lactamase class C family)